MQLRDFICAIRYNARGRPSSITYGDGTSTDFNYNTARCWLEQVLTTRGSDVLLEQGYVRNEKGMITAITSPVGANIRSYGCDGLDRLILSDAAGNGQ